jgi:hypothetical protein
MVGGENSTMASPHFLVLHIRLKPSFLALSRDEREKVLANIAAPIQEFTGEDGGVIFSEGWRSADDGSYVSLIVSMLTYDLAQAFYHAMERGEVGRYFEYGVAFGQIFASASPEDITQHVFRPFLDA